jgi:hypothetical protein
MSRLRQYLQDPFLGMLYKEIRDAGSIRSISVDITSKCNLRCKGCYFFAEEMDKVPLEMNDEAFDTFIEDEKARGTNFVTIVGGEPALVPDRIRKIHQNFKTNVATNGLIKIPQEGLESMPIGIAIWGDHKTDSNLRGRGDQDYFSQAMDNYRGDDRAFWYYTVAPGCADEIESVVEQCIANGNPVLFNYYSDVEKLGGTLDYRQGFDHVRAEIDRMVARFPGQTFTTPYFNKVITTGRLFEESWGYKVCTNLSTNSPVNTVRMQNGKPYNPHFRAYNADFTTTRRCCTGITRDCASCFDTWEHFSWIMINMKKHLSTKSDFSNWLTTMYIFYLVNRLVDYEKGMHNLEKIQQMQLVSTKAKPEPITMVI